MVVVVEGVVPHPPQVDEGHAHALGVRAHVVLDSCLGVGSRVGLANSNQPYTHPTDPSPSPNPSPSPSPSPGPGPSPSPSPSPSASPSPNPVLGTVLGEERSHARRDLGVVWGRVGCWGLGIGIGA